MVPHLPVALAISLGTVILVGCGGRTGPTVVPVTGTVKVKGQPVEGVQVTFMAPGAPRASTGTTDAQGRFRLTTMAVDDGAIPGKNSVSIANRAAPHETMSPDNPSAGYDQMMNAAASASRKKDPGKGLIPDKYADPATSGFTAEVSPGAQNDFTFDIP